MTIHSGAPTRPSATFHRQQRLSSGLSIRRETLVRILLTAMVYIALWRSTGMWIGYPSDINESAPVDPLPMKIILYSLIPLIGLYIGLESKRALDCLSKTPFLILILIGCCIASMGVSENFGASVRGAAAVILLSLPIIFFRYRYGGARLGQSLLYFCIVAAFLNIAYTVAVPQFAIMRGSYAGMVKGLFYHKNILGQFCAIALIILLPLRLSDIKLSYRSLARMLALLMTLLLIVVSRSSTAVIMAGAGIGVLSIIHFLQKIRQAAARSIVVFFLTVVLLVTASSVYLGALAAIAELFGKDITFSGRTFIWEQLIPLIADRPIFGYGFAMFRQPEIMEQFVRLSFAARSTHNTYLELALNIGLPGTIAFVLFLFRTIGRKMTEIHIDRLSQETQKRDIAIIILVMVGAFMEAGFMLAPLSLWVLLLCALPQDQHPESHRRMPLRLDRRFR